MDATVVQWQAYLQSAVLGLIFAYLLAKLISVVVSFKENNLTITRDSDSDYVKLDSESDAFRDPRGGDAASSGSRAVGGAIEDESVIAEQGSDREEGEVSSADDDDDDWEGVESTELDEFFSAATAFVAATAADRAAHRKVSNDVQLQLYGLYKIATEGPCGAPQPSALKMTARAKWQAWQKLGAMPPEDAMQKYIDIVTELFPSWLDGSSAKKRGRDGEAASKDGKGGPMGPVFSTYVYEEEPGVELKMDAIHDFAREGDSDNLLKCIDSGVSVNHKDGEGRTPLHWAVDRGHQNIIETLLTKNADVNAKDNEGQTPLHYAVVCERESIAEYLVKQKADTDLKDNDGDSPADLCDSKWSFMAAT